MTSPSSPSTSDARSASELRTALMNWLNEFALPAPAILGLARRSQPVTRGPGDVVIPQGEAMGHVFFLVRGRLLIRVTTEATGQVVGERLPVTMLGEISYFNNTASTASVEVAPDGEAVLLELSYDDLDEVVHEHPDVRQKLARIGDLRMITQKFGLAPYSLFMHLIGWRRDRFAMNRALLPALEDAVREALLPVLGHDISLLEVGDGPGVICELVHEQDPGLLPELNIRARELEQAIADPLTPRGSDFLGTEHLHDQFGVVVAYEVFKLLEESAVDEQFRLARRLVKPGGRFMLINLVLLDTVTGNDVDESEAAFGYLNALLEKAWPGLVPPGELVHVTFLDADMDPGMEWNAQLSEKARDGLTVPKHLDASERALLERLLAQARIGVFNPDEVHHHWLMAKAAQHGFEPEVERLNTDISFFYQRYRLIEQS